MLYGLSSRSWVNRFEAPLVSRPYGPVLDRHSEFEFVPVPSRCVRGARGERHLRASRWRAARASVRGERERRGERTRARARRAARPRGCGWRRGAACAGAARPAARAAAARAGCPPGSARTRTQLLQSHFPVQFLVARARVRASSLSDSEYSACKRTSQGHVSAIAIYSCHSRNEQQNVSEKQLMHVRWCHFGNTPYYSSISECASERPGAEVRRSRRLLQRNS